MESFRLGHANAELMKDLGTNVRSTGTPVLHWYVQYVRTVRYSAGMRRTLLWKESRDLVKERSCDTHLPTVHMYLRLLFGVRKYFRTQYATYSTGED